VSSRQSCAVLRVDSTGMLVKSTRRVFFNHTQACKIDTQCGTQILPCSVSNSHSNSYCQPKCLSIVCAFVIQKLQGRLRTDIFFIGCLSVKDLSACLVLQFYYLVSLCILSAHVLVCSLLSVLQFFLNLNLS
jgi:hypothetical protein